MVSLDRSEMIERQLRASLSPSALDIVDDSAKHRGHPGARSGGGHFSVTIVSAAFTGKGLLQRHRMIYDALGAAMHGDIHALSIRAYSPEESSPLNLLLS